MTHGVLVVGAAPVPGCDDFYRSLLGQAEHVVAADAAGEWCVRLGRVPDLVVGDFDSSADDAERRLAALGAHVERYPADKDLTDLELAVDLALRRWAQPVTLTAAFSGRLDHTLAALGLVARAGRAARIEEPGWRAWECCPDHPLRLDLPAGATYSLIALEPCRGVTAKGGRWELASEELPPLSGRGVSNEAVGVELTVSVDSGSLIVFAIDDVSHVRKA